MHHPFLKRLSANDCQKLESQLCGLLAQLHRREISGLLLIDPFLREVDAGRTAVFGVVNPKPDEQLLSMGVVTITHGPVYLVGHVSDVVTRDDQRGKGFARLIMDAIVDYGRTYGCTTLELTSADHREPAIRLYKGLGFQIKHTNFFTLTL